MFEQFVNRLGMLKKMLLLIVTFTVPFFASVWLAILPAIDDIKIAAEELKGLSKAQELYRSLFNEVPSGDIRPVLNELHEITDDYGLSTDPSLDSYHLIMIVTYVVPNLAETIHSERANLDKSVTDQQRALVSFLLNEADSYLNDAYTFNRNEAQQTSVGLLLKNLDAVKATITSYFEDKKQIESSWQALKDLTLRSIAETKTAISNRHKQHVNDAKQSAILFSLAMLSFGFFAWIITHTVSKRLRALSQVAKRAGSAKDLSILSNDASEDEIGVVALSFNELISTLRTILHNIKHSGSLVSNSSAEIAAVSRQQQATTAQIAATTTQIEATSKHIAATSGELAANMRNIQHITEQTSSRATDGQENLEKNAGHRPWNYHSS